MGVIPWSSSPLNLSRCESTHTDLVSVFGSLIPHLIPYSVWPFTRPLRCLILTSRMFITALLGVAILFLAMLFNYVASPHFCAIADFPCFANQNCCFSVVVLQCQEQDANPLCHPAFWTQSCSSRAHDSRLPPSSLTAASFSGSTLQRRIQVQW